MTSFQIFTIVGAVIFMIIALSISGGWRDMADNIKKPGEQVSAPKIAWRVFVTVLGVLVSLVFVMGTCMSPLYR